MSFSPIFILIKGVFNFNLSCSPIHSVYFLVADLPVTTETSVVIVKIARILGVELHQLAHLKYAALTHALSLHKIYWKRTYGISFKYVYSLRKNGIFYPLKKKQCYDTVYVTA